MDEIMTITYDEKDQHAIDFAKWIISHKDIEKRQYGDRLVEFIGDRALYPTIEELYQRYFKNR